MNTRSPIPSSGSPAAGATRRQFLAVAGAGVLVSSALEGQAGSPAAHFLDPPFEARPSTYWVWLNGFTDRGRLTYELEELKKNGVGAAYILEIGSRSKAIPAGPAYFGPESIATLAHVVREAGRLGMEIGVTNASSWNSGGAWVTPEHASKGLYHSSLRVKGPARISEVLPMPALPAAPAYPTLVAAVAVPEAQRVPGFDFLIDLAPGAHTIDRVVLHNGRPEFAAREFVVYASATGTDSADFREVLRGALQPQTEPQAFRFAPARAQYVLLRILSGYDPGGRVEVAEFEGFSADGRNVVTTLGPQGRKITGGLLRHTAELGLDREWRAQNICDGILTGPLGSWAAQGPPPPLAPQPSGVVDLTGKVDADGRLTWDVPPGDWTILRFIQANTGQRLVLPSPHSQGLIIDHFSAPAARMHTRHMLERLRGELGDLRKTALKYFYACSYEVRGAIWTPELPAEFRRRRGYDMTPFLPVLAGAVVESEDVSERFRIDLRRTIADLFIENFYRASRDTANDYGLKLVAEAGGPGLPLHQVPVDALKALGTLDIPRGEFWHGGRMWVVKETAAASHIYGRRLVQMEAFTSWAHWQDGPFDLKPSADRAFCEGMNHVVWHTMPHVPPQAGRPGWSYHAGTHLMPGDTWWPMARPFLDYLARCSHMLRQGLFVGDVCYYYGERGWNFVQEKTVDPSLGPGFDYDVTNSDVVLTRMAVKDGRIVLPDGLSYEVLALPERPDMDLEILEKLERLVREGATIAGPKPGRATGLKDYPRCDENVRKLADRIWGRCDGRKVREAAYGKGRVFWNVPLREILSRRGVGPDFAFTSGRGEADFDFIHRRDGDAEIYFVRNRKDQWNEADCTFRVKGREPEIFDPVSGETRVLPVYEAVEGGTRIALALPPAGSVFVVFRGAATGAAALTCDGAPLAGNMVSETSAEVSAGAGGVRLVAFKPGRYALRPGREIVVSPPPAQGIVGPWELSFPPGLGAPPSKTFHKLVSWTEDPEPGIRYFSGIATYRKTFDLLPYMLAEGLRLYLDLGDVRAAARASLNGKPLGIAWAAPFRLDLAGAARAGANRLEVEVANCWSNRITGDSLSTGGPKYTNISLPWKKDAPLLLSGLLGPVRILAASEAELR
jgi:hypothetical protein